MFPSGTMVPVKVSSYYDIESKEDVNILVVGGEAFDWSYDPDSVAKAREMANGEDFTARGFEGMIRKHLELCFSEFMLRPVTIAEVARAVEDGAIMA